MTGVFPPAAILFVVSAGALAFEVLLTRLFSLSFQYHYAFLSVSLAILGLGIGALLSHRLGFAADPARSRAGLALSVLAFAISLPLAAVLYSRAPSSAGYFSHILIGLLPFIPAGMFSAGLYAAHSKYGAFLYASDLLGGVTGLALSIIILNRLGAYNSAFFLGSLTALGALFVARSARLRLASILCAAMLLSGLLINRQQALFDLPKSGASAPLDKVMYHILADPDQGARIIETSWSPFARVDLVQTNAVDQMYVFTDAGAGSYMIRFNGDLEEVAWLRDQIEYLPFLNGPVERTLVLGAGAGKDVLQALLAGSREIIAVEINPAMVNLTRRYSAYNGSILDREGVSTVVTDGRNFVERAGDRYDLIYLNMVYAQANTPGSAALNEAYVFTEQAFRAYWRKLAPRGRLAIVSHQALEGSRALMTAIGSLEKEGLRPADVLARSALVMYPDDDPTRRISVLVLRKSPWAEEEMAGFTQDAAARGMQALYVPGVFEITLRGLTTNEVNLEKFLSDAEYNIAPTTDDSPFFYNLDPGLPGPLVTLLVAVFAFIAVYLVISVFNRHTPSTWQFAYFGLIGVGFMLIEAPLIQRGILLLGNPTLTLAVVVGALLLSAGIGSLVSGRWPEEKLLAWVARAALITAGIAVVLVLFQPPLIRSLLPAALGWRVLASAAMLAPLGLALGVPFSSGLRLAGREHPEAVSLLWGWNAITSVLGSAAAAIIAMLLGFSWAMGLGAICYLVLAGMVSLKR